MRHYRLIKNPKSGAIVEAFLNYCDTKKNETVERYKFFTRVQEAGETLDKFITDVKFWLQRVTLNSLKNH